MEIYIAAFCSIWVAFILYLLIEKKTAKRDKPLFYFIIAILLFVISMSAPY